MGVKCSWCGVDIIGEVVAPGHVIRVTFGIGADDNEVDIETGFCCNGCAWAWGIESHGLMGITGKEARLHLIEAHGLKHPPGLPAGRQSSECFEQFAREAEDIVKFLHEVESYGS